MSFQRSKRLVGPGGGGTGSLSLRLGQSGKAGSGNDQQSEHDQGTSGQLSRQM